MVGIVKKKNVTLLDLTLQLFHMMKSDPNFERISCNLPLNTNAKY